MLEVDNLWFGKTILKKIILCVLTISIFPDNIFGQEVDSVAHHRKRLYPKPIIYWSSDTKWVAGSELIYVIGQGPKLRPTVVSAIVMVTQKKQLMTTVGVDQYWYDNRYHLVGGAGFTRFPFTFYGLGNHTKKTNGESYIPQTESVFLNFLKNFSDGYYLGGHYEFDYTRVVKIQPGGNLDTNAIAGKSSGVSSGLGVAATWDTRDNILYPAHGRYYRVSFIPFSEIFGSRYKFNRVNFDLRQYFSVWGSHVFAYQIYVNVTTGDPPFYKMSALGGPNLMRGYPRRRFRDRDMIAFQAEYRMPLFWRIGIAGFAGAGEVAHRVGDLKMSELKYSVGGGIRFQIDKKNRTNMRLDMGFAKKSSYPALAIQEAF